MSEQWEMRSKVARERRKKKVAQNAIWVRVVYAVHFPVKMRTCINHLTCVSARMHVCVRESLAGGGALTWQSSTFLLGGDVMRTSSPLADRQPCLCSPPEEKPHCVSVCVCVSV